MPTAGQQKEMISKMTSIAELMEWREWKTFEEEEKKEKAQKEKDEREAKEFECEQRRKDAEKFREEVRKDQEAFFMKLNRQQKRGREEEMQSPEGDGGGEEDYKDKLRGVPKRKQAAVAPVEVEVWKDWTCGNVNAKAVMKAFPGAIPAEDCKGLSLIELGEALQEELGDKAELVGKYKKMFRKEPLARWAKLDIILAILGRECDPEEE
jgi:hypothetical protein